jgi:hypothetical protein
MPSQTEIKVPRLKIQRALKIQNFITKKQTQQVDLRKKGIRPEDFEKFKFMEVQLDKTKSLIRKEQLSNKLLQTDNRRLSALQKKYLGTNQLLVSSNLRYEEKWSRSQFQLEFYKKFYNQNYDTILREQRLGFQNAAKILDSVKVPDLKLLGIKGT